MPETNMGFQMIVSDSDHASLMTVIDKYEMVLFDCAPLDDCEDIYLRFCNRVEEQTGKDIGYNIQSFGLYKKLEWKSAVLSKKTQKMELLVTDLLNAALDDLGEMTVNCTDESAAVLYDIIRAADTRSLVRGCTIPECMIHIDIKRMAQVIGNIIGNSYKYAGTPIDIGCALSGDYLKLSITDYGKGVPVDELDLIMNKFYRGRNVKDSGIDGSGLGLYIALALMAKMNGELICSSRGNGLTVTLMILLS